MAVPTIPLRRNAISPIGSTSIGAHTPLFRRRLILATSLLGQWDMAHLVVTVWAFRQCMQAGGTEWLTVDLWTE